MQIFATSCSQCFQNALFNTTSQFCIQKTGIKCHLCKNYIYKCVSMLEAYSFRSGPFREEKISNVRVILLSGNSQVCLKHI